jgi:hypothetical protein
LDPVVPITVHVDASVRIDGHANTVILPPSPATNSTASGQVGLDRTAQGGHVHAESLASAVLTALRDAGVVVNGGGGGGGGVGACHPDHRAQRSLEVNIDAGLSITGEKNVICAGTPRIGMKDASTSATASGVQELRKRYEETEVLKQGSRKRRAESVSLMMDIDGLGKDGGPILQEKVMTTMLTCVDN